MKLIAISLSAVLLGFSAPSFAEGSAPMTRDQVDAETAAYMAHMPVAPSENRWVQANQKSVKTSAQMTTEAQNYANTQPVAPSENRWVQASQKSDRSRADVKSDAKSFAAHQPLTPSENRWVQATPKKVERFATRIPECYARQGRSFAERRSRSW